MRIRLATPADFETLQEIERRAGTLFIDVGLPEIAEHPAPTLDELHEAEALLVAVATGGQVVGYAWVERVDGETHLEQLSVLPEHGRQGVGTALLDAVVDWAHARGDRAVTLTTFRDVPFNGPLYAKRGFCEVPEAEWTEAERQLVADEAAMGLEPATRMLMRRSVQ